MVKLLKMSETREDQIGFATDLLIGKQGKPHATWFVDRQKIGEPQKNPRKNEKEPGFLRLTPHTMLMGGHQFGDEAHHFGESFTGTVTRVPRVQKSWFSFGIPASCCPNNPQREALAPIV